jgi:ABC-type multidrug transport system permease subunit
MNQIEVFFAQLFLGLKLYLRIPSAVIWGIAFPVVMLLGMGTIFSGASDDSVKLVWAQASPPSALDGQLNTALTQHGVTLEVLDPKDANDRWALGKMAAMLEGSDGHYHLRVNSYLGAQGMQLDAVVQQAFLVAQARLAGASELAQIPVEMNSPGGHHGGPYAAYLLPGLLGLNLLMLGIFSVGMVDVALREKGGYKRLATTPLPRHIYLGAMLGVRLIMMVFSASLLLAVGALAFGIHNQGSYVTLYLLLLLGASCFISMGYVMASFARTIDAYQGFSNLIFLPLMLLSGVYFSLDAAPLWLQRGADLLPLAPLLQAIRAVFNDGASAASEGGAIAIVAAWAIFLFIVATRRFKWV